MGLMSHPMQMCLIRAEFDQSLELKHRIIPQFCYYSHQCWQIIKQNKKQQPKLSILFIQRYMASKFRQNL